MLSVSEAAAVTGRAPDVIRLWLRAGRVPGLRTPSGAWLLSSDSLDAIRSIEKRARTRPSV